jgi:2,5-furandicarboxylate decarboxylase 1
MTARSPVSLAATLGDWLSHPRVPLKIVDDAVDPAAFEATAILEQLESAGAPPTVLFPNVRSLDGSRGEFKLLFNAYGTLDAIAPALGSSATTWPDLLKDYVKKVRDLREPVRIEQAAVHENVVRGAQVDLRVLPWTRHVAGEGGDYFTPIVVARDPAGRRRYNLSWNRAMILDERHVGVHISPRDLWGFHRAAEGNAEPLPVALVLGHHPAFNLGAAAIAGSSVDEYHLAGALLGHGVRVVPSQSYGEELLVPADAEVIIEGRLLPGTRVVEGPFGEYMRYLGPQKLSHVLEVDALTWRKGAVIVEIFTCHLDHLNAHISIEASFLEKAQAAVPQVTGVSWFRGGGPTTLVIKMKKTTEGQPMRSAMAAMAASNLVKQVIVVDDDIDIENPGQVLWAVSSRMRADTGLVPLKNLQGISLDPSGSGPFDTTSGFVMDATWPLNRPHPPTGRVDDALLKKFPLSRYRIKDGR